MQLTQPFQARLGPQGDLEVEKPVIAAGTSARGG